MSNRGAAIQPDAFTSRLMQELLAEEESLAEAYDRVERVKADYEKLTARAVAIRKAIAILEKAGVVLVHGSD